MKWPQLLDLWRVAQTTLTVREMQIKTMGKFFVMYKICKDQEVWGWRSRKIHTLMLEIKIGTPLRGKLSKICSIPYLNILLDPGIWLPGIYANDKSTKELI